MLIKINNIEQLRKVRWIKYRDFETQIGRSTYRKIVTWKEKASDWSIKKMATLFRVSERTIKNLLSKNKKDDIQ